MEGALFTFTSGLSTAQENDIFEQLQEVFVKNDKGLMVFHYSVVRV
jgi:hypothetical protein